MTTDTDPTLQEAAFDVMREHLLEVKEQFGSFVAKAIINAVGLAERMADIKPEQYNDVIARCKVKLNPIIEEHPLDAVGAETPQKSVEMRRMSPEVLAEALAVIDAIPEAERTIEAVLGALWATWVD